MDTTAEQQRRLEDVANAAAILLGAVQDAPEGTREEVEALYTEAEVVIDGDAVDVTLHGKGATVHVRR